MCLLTRKCHREPIVYKYIYALNICLGYSSCLLYIFTLFYPALYISIPTIFRLNTQNLIIECESLFLLRMSYFLITMMLNPMIKIFFLLQVLFPPQTSPQQHLYPHVQCLSSDWCVICWWEFLTWFPPSYWDSYTETGGEVGTFLFHLAHAG